MVITDPYLFLFVSPKALLGINHLVQSTPQSFSQSFSSSSVLKPSGQVVSSSIYTDSTGKKVLNGGNFPTNLGSVAVPVLYNFLIPPGDPNGLPYVIETDDQQTPPPVPKPPSYLKTSTTAAPTVRPTIAVTTRITQASTSRTTTSSTIRPIPSVDAKLVTSRPTTQKPSANNQQTTSSNRKRNDGSYVHDNSGRYKPDSRGQYRAN